MRFMNGLLEKVGDLLRRTHRTVHALLWLVRIEAQLTWLVDGRLVGTHVQRMIATIFAFNGHLAKHTSGARLNGGLVLFALRQLGRFAGRLTTKQTVGRDQRPILAPIPSSTAILERLLVGLLQHGEAFRLLQSSRWKAECGTLLRFHCTRTLADLLVVRLAIIEIAGHRIVRRRHVGQFIVKSTLLTQWTRVSVTGGR